MDNTILKPQDNWSSCIKKGKVGELPALFIEHPNFSAVISLFGAQLLSYKQKDQEPLIWLSDCAKFDGTIPIRGGVPICFPWFGAKESSPTHGFARTALWQLDTYKIADDRAEVALSLSYSSNTLDRWPHKFRSIIKFELGDELSITLETTNLDSKAWVYTGALHTYLNVADVSRVSIDGVGESYFDGTNGYELTQGKVPMNIDGETIRVSIETQEEIVVSDLGHQRSISVKNSGHNAAVVWNPWKETTSSMSDMADDEYQNMLCVESAIYSHEPVTVEPGETHCLSTRIVSF
ncbi:D-hexose-6-phosphate mutarotase [Vibrio parahaemolyticus]|uniref:D-hexose-6-phosphate mutarotase n=1 Tax=Vibrio parahaemolyticus TaxID=670 RepID=UPI0015DFC8A5|nr:D-hexose-6-phosphate mutarotase [Vibrio parahaemolyticus]HCM1552945.1 D-hexose-6-phosphate mutarotase [Vibrio parahaemolyticus]